MAINYSVQGSFSGRLGNMIGYRMFGRNYLRSMPSQFHDRRSEAQLSQRGRFKAMILFAQRSVTVLRTGLHTAARGQRMHPANLFLKLNNDCFTESAGTVTVDYRRLRFSAGPVGGVAFSGLTLDADGVAEVRWEKLLNAPQTRNDDRVHIVLYSAAARYGMVIASVGRREKHARFLLPALFAGGEVYVYGFVSDAQGRCSATTFIGRADQCGESESETLMTISAPSVAPADAEVSSPVLPTGQNATAGPPPGKEST